MARPIIIDFDNTMGLARCDVDDGLALLYLLGRDDVEILGLCTTYGNSALDAVHENTLRLVSELGLDIPVLRGAEPQACEAESCEAARFIAETTAARPGEVAIIATGSTTNLAEACALDSHALDRAASIDLMGGITQTLVVGERIMDELNLSIDAVATLRVLKARPASPIAIATANHCLPAYFTEREFTEEFGRDSWIARTCQPWFAWMRQAFGIDGWTCWDIVATSHSVEPALFEERPFVVTLYERLLQAGYLEQTRDDTGRPLAVDEAGTTVGLPPHAIITTPAIRDVRAFKAHVFERWHAALDKLGLE